MSTSNDPADRAPGPVDDATPTDATTTPATANPAALVETALEYVLQLGGAVVAIIVGSMVHGHFAPKAALCDTAAGQYAQQNAVGGAANCGLNSLLSIMGSVVKWGGVAMLVVTVGLVLVAYAAQRATAAKP